MMETEHSALSTELSNSDFDLVNTTCNGISGCIIGGAIGDGFGLATEFMSKATAKHYYGIGPLAFGNDSSGFTFIRDSHRGKWHENDFTDDTDQSLLILQCLLGNTGLLNPIHFAYRLKEWFKYGLPELEKLPYGVGFTVGSVISQPEFIFSPHRTAFKVWDKNKRNLAANGAVMRTAVLGIPFYWDEMKVVENSINAAKVTHADPRSVTSAVVVSVIVSRLLLRLHQKQPKKLTTEDKEKITELLLNGSIDDSEEMLIKNQSILDKIVPKANLEPPQPNRVTQFFNRLFGVKDSFDKKYLAKVLPTKMNSELLAERGKTPAQVHENQGPSIETFGVDAEMLTLCKEVVDDYKFLLHDNALCPVESSDDVTKTRLNTSWLQELESFCFTESLSDLKLDASDSIGYTFKCLGAGIYCLTRAKPSDMTPGNFFKTVITELTLEGGDADTNCAVAGALLGIRLGKDGLPEEWMALRHKAFLDNLIDNLCTLVDRKGE